MINRVIVSGRLGADPRITDFDGGGKAAQFSIAVTERGYKKGDGTEVPDRTEWIRIETGRAGIAGVIEKFLKKGSHVTIDGKLRNREWEKDGVKQYSTVVQIESMELGPKNGESTGGNGAPPPEVEQPQGSRVAKNSSSTATTNSAPPPNYQEEDDLPF